MNGSNSGAVICIVCVNTNSGETGQQDAALKLTSDGSAGDFVLKNTDGEHLYEVTEVLNEEERRKRAQFTRVDRMKVQHVSADEMSGALARRLVPKRIAAKSQNRRYTGETGLVVYVDIYTDFEHAGTSGFLPSTLIPFKTVWLLADENAFCLFEKGST